MDDLLVNVGTERCCLFISMSRQVLQVLKRNPVLYFAVEEALLSEKQGWYAVGILAWSQMLNVLNRPTPASRNAVAHELLRRRPTKGDFDATLDQLKLAATEQASREVAQADDPATYRAALLQEWTELISDLHGGATDVPTADLGS